MNKKNTHYAFCLTVNNPTASDIEHYYKILDNVDEECYAHIIVGWEGYKHDAWLPFKKTPHWQIALCYGYRVTFAEVKRQWPRAHIEVLRSDYDKAVEYCKKEGRFDEAGDVNFANWLLYRANVLDPSYLVRGERGDVSITSPLISSSSPCPVCGAAENEECLHAKFDEVI